MNPSRFQTTKAGELDVMGVMNVCLPVNKDRLLPRGELQFLQELLGSN